MRVPSFDSGAVNLPRGQGQGPGPVIGPSMVPRIAESARDIEQGNEAVLRIGRAMQRVEDEARVDAEDNGLSDEFRTVLSEFETTAGMATVDGAAGVETKLREAVKVRERALQNDMQRAAFRDRANQRLESALNGVARKRVRELVNTSLAQKKEARKQAALDYSVEAAGEDPDTARVSYDKAMRAHDELAAAEGLPDDLRASQRLELTTAMHSGALKRLADSGAMFRAAGYLEAHRGEMTKDAAATWESVLREQGETAQAVVLAEQLRQIPKVWDRRERANEMLKAGNITETQHKKLLEQVQMDVAYERQQRDLDTQSVRDEAVKMLDAAREQIAQSVAGPLPRAPWSTLETVLPPSLLADVDRLGLRGTVQDYMDNKGWRATPEGIARYDLYMGAPDTLRGVSWEAVSGEMRRGLDNTRFGELKDAWRKANAVPTGMESVPNFDADFRRLVVNQLMPETAGKKETAMAQAEIDARDATWQRVLDAVLAANPKNAVEARKYAQEIAADWAREAVQNRQTGGQVLPYDITEQNVDDLFVESDFDANPATPQTRVDLRDLRVGETLRRTEMFMLARATELRKTHVPANMREAAYIEAAAREGNRAVMARYLGQMREAERVQRAADQVKDAAVTYDAGAGARQMLADAKEGAQTFAAERVIVPPALREPVGVRALMRKNMAGAAIQAPGRGFDAANQEWLNGLAREMYDPVSDPMHFVARDFARIAMAAGIEAPGSDGEAFMAAIITRDVLEPIRDEVRRRADRDKLREKRARQ